MGELKLTFDKDWPILDAFVQKGAFSGHGCAHFPTGQEKAFVDALDIYPIECAELSLGGPGKIGISIRPSDDVGHLAVTITVAEDMPPKNTAHIILRAEYSQITRFRNQLELMAKGELAEISLTELL